MAIIRFAGFLGANQALQPMLLPDMVGVTSTNQKPGRGDLRPWKAPLTVVTDANFGSKLTIHRFGRTGSAKNSQTLYWAKWPQDVSLVVGGNATDTAERTYYSGSGSDGLPRWTDIIKISAAGSDSNTGSRLLGIPAPSSTITLSASGGAAATTETRFYTYTFVTDVGEESAPNPYPKAITCKTDDVVTIGGMAEPASDNWNITTFRIYRTQDGQTTAGAFYFLKEIGPEAPTIAGGFIPGQWYVVTTVGTAFAGGAGSVSSTNTLGNVFLAAIPGTIGLTGAATRTLLAGNFVIGDSYTITSVGTTDFAALALPTVITNTVGNTFTANAVGTGTGTARRVGSTASTTDNNRSLGEALATANYLPAPGNTMVADQTTVEPKLTQLTGLWNGMMAGISGRSVRFCEPFIYYAWPFANEIVPTNATPVALATYGQTLVMLTDGNPSIITGGSPDSMDEQPVEFFQACIAPKSAVGMGHGVAWASPDGLAYIGSGGPRMLTEGVMTRDDWQALVPTTIIGCMYERRYFGFYNDGAPKCFIIDPANPQGIYFLDFGCTALYLDDTNDSLFVLNSTSIQLFDGGTALTATFKSKVFHQPKPVQSFACAEVLAEAYPVTFKLYADGALKHTKTVTSAAPFRLPGGYYAQDFQVQVETTGSIQMVAMAHSMAELTQT